jgi:Methyltransferase FkbM domain
MRVQHPTSPTTELEVKAMLPEDFPAIDKTAFAKVHPASFVLTNLSNRAIVALVVGRISARRTKNAATDIVSVDAISLDEWHEIAGFPAIRLIKIDAEGSEPFILEGMRRLISKTRPFLIVELNDQLLHEAGYSKSAITQAIKDNQYRIFSMNSEGLREFNDSEDMISPELLCLPSDGVGDAKAALRGVLPMRKSK